MGNRRIILTAVVLTITFAAWYFWPKVDQEIVNSKSPENIVVQSNMKPLKPEKEPLKVADVLNNPYAHPKRYEQIKRVQRFQEAMSSGFEYFGRVVDQNGYPVIGAEVTARWAYFPLIPNGDFGPSYKNLTLVTDNDGRFSIKKSKGMSIEIRRIDKSGYEIKALRGYMFSDGGQEMLDSFSDPAKPVIFHAWKKTESEPLYYGEYKQKLRDSGVFETINIPELGSGLSASFDLDPNGVPYKPENWKITLKVNTGGIVESSNQAYMNLAPDSGYRPIWAKNYMKGTEGFTDEDRKKFYFHSGNNYGRMEINYVAYYKEGIAGILRIKYWINPTGSRNLQYDPSIRIQ